MGERNRRNAGKERVWEFEGSSQNDGTEEEEETTLTVPLMTFCRCPPLPQDFVRLALVARLIGPLSCYSPRSTPFTTSKEILFYQQLPGNETKISKQRRKVSNSFPLSTSSSFTNDSSSRSSTSCTSIRIRRQRQAQGHSLFGFLKSQQFPSSQ